MKIINEQNKEQILNGKKVVVKYGAPWCSPCKQYNTALSTLSPELELYSCDVDECPTWATELNIRSIPITILFDNGVEVNRLVGQQSKETVLKLFE